MAIKSHKARRQNPALDVQRTRHGLTLQLLGLHPGSVESADRNNPAKLRLDFYISRADLLAQRSVLPRLRVRPSERRLSLTNPTGTERRGGKRISWRGPIRKLDLAAAIVVFPDGPYVMQTSGRAFLNVDWEPAVYPLPDGTRRQLHVGVEAEWSVTRDRRRTVADAKIFLTRRQYTDLIQTLNMIR